MSSKEARKRALQANQDKKQEYVRKQKEVPCADCGCEYPHYVMDFDHLPGFPKSFNLSQTNHVGLHKIKLEIAKCEVVCANCHRKRTWDRLTECQDKD